MADEFGSADFGDESVDNLPQPKKEKKKKGKKKGKKGAEDSGKSDAPLMVSNELFDEGGGGSGGDDDDDDDGPVGRRVESTADDDIKIFTDEQMAEELGNRPRLVVGKVLQLIGAVALMCLCYGTWASYSVATSSCYLHGGSDTHVPDGDDPCAAGVIGFCMIQGHQDHSAPHGTRELCESCGCGAGDEGGTWDCAECGDGEWFDGYCDCATWEECTYQAPVTTEATCVSQPGAVWTPDANAEGSCSGTPRNTDVFPDGCDYHFLHMDPFVDSRDNCPGGCVYTPAPGSCSVGEYSHQVVTKEDCSKVAGSPTWEEGRLDDSLWNAWLTAGFIVGLLGGAVFAFLFYGLGWRTAQDWGFPADIAM